MARSTLPPPVEVPDGYGVLRLEAMWTPPEHAAAFAAARMPEVWPVSCPSPPLYCCWPSNVRSRRWFLASTATRIDDRCFVLSHTHCSSVPALPN